MSNCKSAITAVAFMIFAILPVSAAVVTWDADTVASGPQDGSGTWNSLSNTNWWNGSGNVPWNSGDTAIIGTPAGVPGMINVDGTINLSGLTIESVGGSGPGSGLYQFSGGTLAFANNSVLKVNQIRGLGTGPQRTGIASSISGANLLITSDLPSAPTVNDVGFLELSGANTNTGSLTLGANVTVFIANSGAFSSGVTSVAINPTSTLDFTFGGAISTPITLNSLGPTDGSTYGIVPTHANFAFRNGGGLRLGGTSVTLDFNSPVTFTGPSEIQAGAGTGNVVNLNAAAGAPNLTSEFHLSLRANQGSTLNLNKPIDAPSVMLSLFQSGSGPGTMNINQPIATSDLIIHPHSLTPVTINAPITLTTAAGAGKITARSFSTTSAALTVNATLTAPGGIEFQRGMGSVQLNSASGFALDTPEILLTPTGGNGNTIIITKADNQTSHDALLHFSGTVANNNVRIFRLEGHTATVGGIQTTDITLASQARIENGLANSIGNFVINDSADHTFAGLILDNGGVLNVAKQGTGTLTLTTANTYTGSTTLSGGKLVVQGNLSGTSAVSVQNGATLGGSGQVGNGSADVIVDAGGTLAPGDGIGELTLNGNATLAGLLSIEYDGDADTIDLLSVTGALDIGAATISFSNLSVANLNGEPHVISSYGTLLGSSFNSVTGMPSGYAIDYNYLGGNQIALVGAVQPGDFDSDGDVDGADFVVWQTNFPTAGGANLATGDADGDGDVDGADFVVWQTNFPTTPGGAVAPVPEPLGIVLLSVGGLGLLISRRFRGLRA